VAELAAASDFDLVAGMYEKFLQGLQSRLCRPVAPIDDNIRADH
jgi:hypothetical protein